MSKRMPKIFYFLSFVGTAYGSLALLRHRLAGKTYEGKEEMYGKTVIVTGANTGIGKEVAKDLSKRGAKVILACRDMNKCNATRDEIVTETFNKKVECVKCDLASLQSIKEFVEHIKKNEKFINVLINNAGVMWCPKSYTKEGFEMHLGVNHLGHFYLTNLLLDKLKLSAPSRIINLSCKTYKAAKINFDDLNSTKQYDERYAYNQSKLANVLFTFQLNEILQGTGVTVNTVDPGVVYTDLLRHSSIHRSSTANLMVAPIFKTFMKQPIKGAQEVIRVAISPEFQNVSGKFFRDFEEQEVKDNGKNKDDAKRLWAISEKWTRLK